MRDLASKMAELKFEAPLAQFEETDEWGPVDYQSSNANLKAAIADTLTLNLKETDNNILIIDDLVNGGTGVGVTTNGGGVLQNGTTETNVAVTDKKDSPNCNTTTITGLKDNVDNFTETISGSLEDLVNTFDEKITKCFGNYEESVEELAPVQVRSQEEIMNDCQ